MPSSLPSAGAPSAAMLGKLAKAIPIERACPPAGLGLANVEDVIGTRVQTNGPETVDQHPTWRRKLTVTVEELLCDSWFEPLTGELRSLRPLV